MQLPFEQTRLTGHVLSTHWPVVPHVCTVFPLPALHCLCPGAQTPAHAPLTQVWLVHVFEPDQFPLAHVCGVLLKQRVCPGPHNPAHAAVGKAPRHVLSAAHATGALHTPHSPQVWSALPEH
jgi:hypothetical protein